MLVSDDFLKLKRERRTTKRAIKPETEKKLLNQEKARRFLRIAIRVPMEIQMIMCNYANDVNNVLIEFKNRDVSFSNVLKVVAEMKIKK